MIPSITTTLQAASIIERMEMLNMLLLNTDMLLARILSAGSTVTISIDRASYQISQSANILGENIQQLDKTLSRNIIALNSWTKKQTAAIPDTKNVTSSFGTLSVSSISLASDLSTLALNAKGLGIKGASGMGKLLGFAGKASPWIAAAGIAIDVGTKIYDIAGDLIPSVHSKRETKRNTKEMEEGTIFEQANLDQIFQSLQKAEEGSTRWNLIRDSIYEKYGGYLAQMGMEIQNTEDATKAQQLLSESIIETNRQKAIDKTLGDENIRYAQEKAELLEEMREDLVEEHGEELGKNYYNELKTALLSGKEFSAELKNAINKLNETVQPLTSDGEVPQTYISNSIDSAISKMSGLDYSYTKRKQEIEESFGYSEKTEAKTIITPEVQPQEKTQTSPKNTKLLPATDKLAPTNDNTHNSIGSALCCSGSPIASGGGTTKTINVTIGSLIDKFEITTGNLREDAGQLRDMVASVLIDAVNDLNTAI